MKNLLLLAIVGILAIGMVGWIETTTPVADDEQEIPVKKLPGSIVQSIQHHYPGAEIEEASVWPSPGPLRGGTVAI